MITSEQWSGKSNPWLVAHQKLQIHQDIAHDLERMQTAASQAGIDCSVASGFRSFERQVVIWNRKWRGELPLYNWRGEELDFSQLSDEQKLEAIMTWSALPGASRHHWGSDIDVYDRVAIKQRGQGLQLVHSEYKGHGPCAKLSKWLQHYAGNYGFTLPFAQYHGGVALEPWHLSHHATARAFEEARNPATLATFIAKSDLLGKATVLAHFDVIYHRYVLNEGKQ